jgi:hypothetical protein
VAPVGSKSDIVYTFPRERGWAAILHQPMPGAGVLGVELLHEDELVDSSGISTR